MKGNYKLIVIVVLCIIITSIMVKINFLSILGIIMVLYLLQLLIKDCSYTFMPIPEIAGVMAGIQWIVSPALSYSFGGQSLYSMSVPETTYMVNTLIMYTPFWGCIVYYNKNKRLYFDKNSLTTFCFDNVKMIRWLIIIGLLTSFIPSTSFIITLLSSLLYIGVIMLMVAFPKKAIIIAIIAICFSLAKSIQYAMFHKTMIWGAFILFTLFYVGNYILRKKLIIIGVCLVAVFTLQSIKAIYRASVWNEDSGNNVELFTSLMINNIFSESDDSNLLNSNDRFNQGWIISRIYSHIPSEYDYIGGRTIMEGLIRSISPSIIIGNTQNLGDITRKDFIEFTGVQINDSTSMGLSIIGEAYGNFGLLGGCLFMFIWGMFIIRIVNRITKLSLKNGIWIFMLPIICFTLIKAEINFISVINWTIKALIFTWFAAKLSRSLFNIKGVELTNNNSVLLN